MNCHAVHKRLACDRCRGQKLRCPRVDNNGDEPCTRCQRAGALCVTGGPRPLGRPRTTASSASAATASSTTYPSRPPMTRSPPATAPMLSWPTSPSSAFVMNDYSSMSLESLLQLPTPDNTGSSNPTEAPLGNIEHSFATLLPDGELVGMATFPQIGAKMQGDGDRDCDTVDSNNRPPPEDADMPPHSHQNVTTGGAALSGTPALGSPEALISLSHLNESISQQLVKFDSYPWDAPSAMQRLCSSKINTITDNPVAEALQTTTRFASILKSLSPSKSLETSSVPDSGVSVASSSHDGSIKGEINSRPGIAASSPLNTATYLLLLSSYLQLMHLFNVMFRRIAKFLGNMTEKAMSEFPQPEFRVTGLPPTMHSRLYLKILMQIIGHQLESVECLMGLSAEHCISGQAPLGKGIFSEQDVSNLLQAVLGQANSGRRLRRTVSEQPLIVSLRESIAVVQELLKG